MIKILSVALLNGRKIQIYLHLWRPGIEVSVTQRLGVFKPITWYGDSRTTNSIPGLYQILTVLQTRNIDHLNFNSNGLSLCASVLFSNFFGGHALPWPLDSDGPTWQKSRGGHPKERLKSVFTVGPTAGFSSSADQLLSLLSVHCTLVYFPKILSSTGSLHFCGKTTV